MSIGNDRRADVIAAQAADQTSAESFLGANGKGRNDLLDMVEQLAQEGYESIPNVVFEKSDVNNIDSERPARIITGIATSRGVYSGRPATTEEILKKVIITLNADSMTGDQFQSVVMTFLDYLVTEDFIVTSNYSDTVVNAKISWT